MAEVKKWPQEFKIDLERLERLEIDAKIAEKTAIEVRAKFNNEREKFFTKYSQTIEPTSKLDVRPIVRPIKQHGREAEKALAKRAKPRARKFVMKIPTVRVTR